MSPRRALADRDRALKMLTKALVQRIGGFEAAASYVRVGISRLHDYTDMKTDGFAPVDVIAALEEAAEEPLVTAELARRASHVLVPIDAQGEGEIAAAMSKLGKEVGDTFSAFGDAMLDGRMDRPEMERLARELAEVAAVARAGIAILARKLGDVT